LIANYFCELYASLTRPRSLTMAAAKSSAACVFSVAERPRRLAASSVLSLLLMKYPG